MIRLSNATIVERGIGARIVNLSILSSPAKNSEIKLPFCGVTYNVRLGDSIFDYHGQILEPGLVLAPIIEEQAGEDLSPHPADLFCIGNKVRILEGDLHGVEGTVVGSSCALRGGVIVDFPSRVYQKIDLDHRFWIIARGYKTKLPDYPSIWCYKIDPDLFPKLELQQAGRNRLMIPVCSFVPHDYFTPLHAESFVGDELCYFNTAAHKEMEKLGLTSLHFGDLIAISDLDCTEGFAQKRGAVTIAAVTMAPVPQWDIGFAVNVLLSCPEGKIVPVTNPNANLGRYLSLGKFRKSF